MLNILKKQIIPLIYREIFMEENMKKQFVRIVLLILAVVSVVSIYSVSRYSKKSFELEKENEKLNLERLSTLMELEECLKHNEKLLKRELIEKYVDSMINLRNKIDAGYVPSDEEISHFFDRTEFIISNMEDVGISNEKSRQYIYFIESMRNLLKSSSVSPEKTKDNAPEKN